MISSDEKSPFLETPAYNKPFASPPSKPGSCVACPSPSSAASPDLRHSHRRVARMPQPPSAPPCRQGVEGGLSNGDGIGKSMSLFPQISNTLQNSGRISGLAGSLTRKRHRSWSQRRGYGQGGKTRGKGRHGGWRKSVREEEASVAGCGGVHKCCASMIRDEMRLA